VASSPDIFQRGTGNFKGGAGSFGPTGSTTHEISTNTGKYQIVGMAYGELKQS